MAKTNAGRKGCRDVFNAHLVAGGEFEGSLEIPKMRSVFAVPDRILPFSQALSKKDYGAWVHFYEDDAKFERVWNQPNRYLPILCKFAGVISPDFSLYRDMPLAMQFWNIYRSRAIGYALQRAGQCVVPNVRWGDERTWDACCLGVNPGSIIAVGSYGNMRDADDREMFKGGLEYVATTIVPPIILVYGAVPEDVFGMVKSMGIEVLAYESAFSATHRKGL